MHGEKKLFLLEKNIVEEEILSGEDILNHCITS
jgi:hypothetical protein